LSNETNNSAKVLSEKNGSSSISADDKINENYYFYFFLF